MENREDLNSVMEFLPPLLLEPSSCNLYWPCQVIEALKSLSRGPEHSRVDSGEVLFLGISDIRDSLFGPASSSSERLASKAAEGYSLFFDELMSRVEATKWFEETIPTLATFLLRFPSLLEAHYQHADNLFNGVKEGFVGVKTGLRLLGYQEAGIVLLNQELIGALLACSLFCLFPTTNRSHNYLPTINMDFLFASLCPNYSKNQENKIKCLVHYFERICSCMPMGSVSFERKVLSEKDNEFWSKSVVPLCSLDVCESGLIEDHVREGIEVDFANKYLGGGALYRGCVQEEIRFMISPELIVGMLFLPSMGDNEAIEIVGAERFSDYTGYASTFRFSGDYADKKPIDCTGRRKTRIVAIDALCSPKKRQYGTECLLREINKAFSGFFDQSKIQCYQKLCQDNELCKDSRWLDTEGIDYEAETSHQHKSPSTSNGMNEGSTETELIQKCQGGHGPKNVESQVEPRGSIGVVTGNWGCGAFGGDPELKAALQWLAASQAMRPFILYYTFGEEALQSLDQVCKWVLSHGWTVGELWNIVMEYSTQRLKGETHAGFFSWLLPSLSMHSPMMLDP